MPEGPKHFSKVLEAPEWLSGLQIFLYDFNIFLKLVEFFIISGQSTRILRKVRKVYKFCNFIQIYSKACRMFYKSKKCLGHSGRCVCFVTSFKIIFVDFLWAVRKSS